MTAEEEAGAPYLPFEGGGFRLMMGLMALPIAQWFEVDRRVAGILAAKRRLLDERRAEVFQAQPAAAAPAAELLALMAEHLPRHHPAVYARDGDRLVNLASGEAWDVARPPLHPLELASRLVPEDLCLLVADGASHRLAAASLCAPARWRLADKIGRPLAAIHDPVPGYAAVLERPVDRFFARLVADKPVWRLNWGIIDDPEPFQPQGRPIDAAIPAAALGDRLYLRVERQTLRRLPATGAVLFTIRTHITRLGAALRTARSAADLASAIRAMPEPMRRYKEIAPIAPALLAWLDARARALP